MKLSAKTFRQIGIVMGLTILALILVNALGVNLALAQGAIDADRDQPGIIRSLSGGTGDFRGIVLTIVNFFLGFLGLLALVMVIYGGFLYVSSAGNEENVNKAKKILLYAVIGIVVIIASFALVNTLLGAGSGQAA